MEDVETLYTPQRKSTDILRPHSTHATIKWLNENYQLEDGVCLPRSTIYEHYLDFCERELIQPVNAASFGKIIRQQFPSLTTRRLGTRGQSKYHYYGLGIKQSSRYYTHDYIEKLNQGDRKKTPDTKKSSFHEKPSTVLPPFPDVNTMSLSERIPLDKLKTFMVMYRAHCQRILDSVVRANFNEVENFLLHFWQGMPTHMLPVLASDVVVDLVAHCDTLLYKVVSNVLITSPLQNLPESLAGEIRTFSDMLRQWMEVALKGLPESLQEAKYKVAEGFVNGLRRQTSLTKLAQVARGELRNSNSLEQLKQDWEAVDLKSAYAQALYAAQPMKIPQEYSNLLPQFLEEFSALLHDDTELEHFMVFAENMIYATVVKGTTEDHYPLKEACQAFLLTWKFFNTKILKEFTMENAPSFGVLILLHMLMDDYITHLLETQLEKEEEKVYYKRIQSMKKDDVSSSPLNNRSAHSHSDSQSSSSSSPVDELSSAIPPFQSSLLPLPSLSPSHKPLSLGKTEPSLSELPTLDTPMSFPSLSLPSSVPSSSMNSIISTSHLIMTTLSHDAPSVPKKSTTTISPQFLLKTSHSENIVPTRPSFHNTSASIVPLNIASKSPSTKYSRSQRFSPIANTSNTLHAPQPTIQGNFQTPLMQTAVTENTPLISQTRQCETQCSPVAFQRQSVYTVSHAGTSMYTQTTQSQHPQQQRSSLVQPLPGVQPSDITKPGIHSPSTYGIIPSSTRTTQVNMGLNTHVLPPCSFSISSPALSQSFTHSTPSLHPQQPLVQPRHSHQNTLQNLVTDLSSTTGLSRLGRSNPTGMVAPTIPNLPNFATIPFSHGSNTSTSLTSSNNLSLFPAVQGMYPYTQFVGIPAQMNTPFAQTGLQMPGPSNSIPGYSYLANVPHTLYNPQVSTSAFTR